MNLPFEVAQRTSDQNQDAIAKVETAGTLRAVLDNESVGRSKTCLESTHLSGRYHDCWTLRQLSSWDR